MKLKEKIAILFVLLFITLIVKAETLNWNRGRGYEPFRFATEEGVKISNPGDTLVYDYIKLPFSSKELTLGFRAKDISGSPNKKYFYVTGNGDKITTSNPGWGCFITCEKDTIVISIKGKEHHTITETVPSLEISIYKLFKKEKKVVTMTKKINHNDGDNLWEINLTDGIFSLNGGNNGILKIAEFDEESMVTGFGFFAGWGGTVLISDISAEFPEPYPSSKNFDLIIERIKDTNDDIEGYYILFDREMEESLLKLGGMYTLVCVKENDNSYSLFYVDGAKINLKNWNPGDLKAKLVSTPFPDVFTVEWYDAMKTVMKNDIKAQKGEGNTLIFQFPYHSSKLRLRKIQME